MCYEFSTHLQIEKLLNNVQAELFDKVCDLSKKSKGYKVLTHFLGFGVGVSSAALHLAAKICTIGETIIKGLSNLFAAPFVKNSNFVTGLQQLFIELPFSIVQILISPIYIIVGTTITTSAMLIMPTTYTNFRYNYHFNRNLEELK